MNKCFYCIAEHGAMVKDAGGEPLYGGDPLPNAVSQYQGTPVCGVHADRIAQGLKKYSNELIFQLAMGK